MGMKMEKERYDFGFRYDLALGERIDTFCESTGSSLNRLMGKALEFALRLHDRRKVRFTPGSGFLMRLRHEERIERMLILSAWQRMKLRDFSYAYRISMAEVLRISLEMYLDYLDRQRGKTVVVKHHYESAIRIIEQFTVVLFPVFDRKPPLRFSG